MYVNGIDRKASPGFNAGRGLKLKDIAPKPGFLLASPGFNAGRGLKQMPDSVFSSASQRFARLQRRAWIETGSSKREVL